MRVLRISKGQAFKADLALPIQMADYASGSIRPRSTMMTNQTEQGMRDKGVPSE
ncbi:hypothetical protein ABIE49_003010 [Bradyrhizobium sp. OAE829]